LSGSIGITGEIDAYCFAAAAGDVVLARMGASVGGALYPEVRLYGPDGTRLCSNWGGDLGETGNCALPSNGSYTVLADDHYGTYKEAYGVSVQKLNGGGNCTSIGFGDTLPGNIGITGQADAYCFGAAAGDSVLARMGASAGGALYPEVRLYGPDGTKLCSGWGGDMAETGNCPLPSNGTYTILADDHYGTYEEAYWMSLSCLTATCGGSGATATPTPTPTRTFTPTPTATTGPGLCGDVNCDGGVDAVDAMFVLQYVVGLRLPGNQCPPPTGYLYLPAGVPVDCDGDCDAVDAMFILQHVVGLRSELCACP
jgi:hypothetical protein